MLPYLLLSLPVALMVLISPARRVAMIPWTGAFAVFVVFVGLRHHVGMDWNNYLLMVFKVTTAPLGAALQMAEPTYALILRLSGQLGYGVYGANLVVAVIVMLGLFRYASTTPNPWLALLVSVPILIVAVSMSANRQAAAIGVLLWAVAGWEESPLWKRALFVALAASFHFSALVFFLFLAADIKMHRSVKAVLLFFLSIIAVYVLEISGRLDYYDKLYISGQTEITQSAGAVFHTLLNGGPAAAYFLLARYRQVLLPNTLHRNMALLALIFVPVSYFASAASGRMTLYLFPVSMYIVAAMPQILGPGTRFIYKSLCAIFFVGLSLFWLVASNTGYAHIPYRNLLNIYESERELCC
jgi:hypothetical protein